MLCGTGNATVISLAKGTSSVFSRNKCLKVNQTERTRRLNNEPSRRSSVRRIDWSKCIFCQTDVKKVALNQVQTFQTSQKILLNVASDRDWTVG